jgi:flavodoxin
MKKYLSIILGIILTACLVACGSSDKGTLNDNEQAIISNQEVSDTEEQELSVENQQTEKDAEADIFEIIPENMYTADDLNYNDDNCRANQEMNDDSARPAISNDLSVVSEYDVIYLGYPIWWGTAPRIIQTFIENYDISGATVYMFCTSGGSGIESSISDLQMLYPDINIVDGKRLNDATETDIREWIESLN